MKKLNKNINDPTPEWLKCPAYSYLPIVMHKRKKTTAQKIDNENEY